MHSHQNSQISKKVVKASWFEKIESISRKKISHLSPFPIVVSTYTFLEIIAYWHSDFYPRRRNCFTGSRIFDVKIWYLFEKKKKYNIISSLIPIRHFCRESGAGKFPISYIFIGKTQLAIFASVANYRSKWGAFLTYVYHSKNCQRLHNFFFYFIVANVEFHAR